MNQVIKKRIEDINNGIVPEGYKQTPFGIFPCAWETTSIGEVSINKGEYGLNAPACEYESGLPKYIRITDIDANGNYVDTGACVDFQDVTKQYTLKEGDVVFARTGATVGRNYLYKEKDGELLYAGFLIKFSINKNVANPYIIYANSNTKQYWNWIKKISARSGQPGVNAEEYSQYRFVNAKDKVEQGKIAEILMKWDEMVELQEQYIQKLELKQLAVLKKVMKNLCGENKKIKDCVTYHPSSLLIKHLKEVEDGFPVYGANEVALYIDKYNFDCDTVAIIKYGSGAGRVCYLTGKHSVLGTMAEMLPKEGVNIKFIYYVLKVFDFKKYIEISTTPNVYFEDYSEEKIVVPNLEAQNRIVESLDAFDDYISLQKEKLEKIKIQRKAMQQYLLTGIVRVS